MITERLNELRGVLLDLDGTLYVSGRLLAGTTALIDSLGRRSLPFLFLTNNSSSSAVAYVDKLRSLGIDADLKQVLTSGQATIAHLIDRTAYRSAYILGTNQLRAEFASAGFALDEVDPDCVVVGYDTSLDYAKLSMATRLLFAGKPYFATHADRTCISDKGLLPDIAATIEGLYAVTGRRPVVLGKPELAMVEAAARRLAVPVDGLAMVGDQLDTDMTMAQRHGLLGVLVLSGETTPQMLEASTLRPDLILADVGELARLIR